MDIYVILGTRVNRPLDYLSIETSGEREEDSQLVDHAMHDGNYVCNLAYLINAHGCFPLPFPRLHPPNFHLYLFISSQHPHARLYNNFEVKTLSPINHSHRSSRCAKLGVGCSGGSQFAGSLMSFFLLSHPYNILTHRPAIANLGLQSCFHELGATPS